MDSRGKSGTKSLGQNCGFGQEEKYLVSKIKLKIVNMGVIVSTLNSVKKI